MRITRYRDLHKLPGYFNPETAAHRTWSNLRGGRYAISRAQAYREVLDSLFAPYAWPGGYQIWFITDGDSVLCADCAKKAYLNDRIDVSCMIDSEGPTMYCDYCNAEIESAYGDPDEQKE